MPDSSLWPNLVFMTRYRCELNSLSQHALGPYLDGPDPALKVVCRVSGVPGLRCVQLMSLGPGPALKCLPVAQSLCSFAFSAALGDIREGENLLHLHPANVWVFSCQPWDLAVGRTDQPQSRQEKWTCRLGEEVRAKENHRAEAECFRPASCLAKDKTGASRELS